MKSKTKVGDGRLSKFLSLILRHQPEAPGIVLDNSGWKDIPALLRAALMRAFPPRLPDQPIFYSVMNEEYATEIARDWNVVASGSGYVTPFEAETAYLPRFEVQTVDGKLHAKLWVPAEELDEFNGHIIGELQVIAEFYPTKGDKT